MLKRRLVLVGIFAAAAISALSFAASGSSAATTSGPFAFVESVREFFGGTPTENDDKIETMQANIADDLRPYTPLAAVSLTTLGSPYTQDFNTLAISGTSSTLPGGWELSESGTGANTTYTAGTGSGTAGDTYSFGSASSTDRAFGGLQSGSVIPTIGASFTNNTGSTITSLAVAYTGEEWRLGATGRVDRLDFQYSTDATSLSTGTWTDANTLDFTAPVTGLTVGALDGNAAANRTSISSSITGLSIPNGSTIWIRWTDFNATGADDGLAVDDFSLTPSGSAGSGSSLVLPVILSESPTISSLVNDPGPLTSAGGVSVWQIGVYDGGISGDPDTLPTIVTGLTIGKGASSTVTDFSSAILAADLFNGGTHLASGVIGPSTVTFSGFNFSVNDNQFASMSIRISLKTSGLTDNQSFQFNLAQSGITTAGAVTSSQIAPFSTFSSQAGQNKIDVAATKLAFGAQPVNVGTGAAMTPAPTVYAADANGNTDTDWATDIAVTATGSVLTGSPVSATPTSGTAAFSGLVFTTAGTGVTLNATSGALTDATSGTFDVLLVPLPGEIVINQFNPAYGAASDEYIEIVNLTNKTFDLSLLRISYASASGSAGGAGGVLSGTLQPYSFWLLSPNPTVNVGQTVNLPADGSFTSGLAGGAGQIALRLVAAPNTKIDGVSYGTITGTNVYGEGSSTSSPTSNAGLSRVPDGHDTNSNVDDFQAVANSAIYLRNSTGRIVPTGVSLPAGTYADISALTGSSVSGDVTINGRLTLGGVVTTGANTIMLGCGGSSAGAGATSYVLGNVRKDFCATGAFSFPVGENGYTPVDTTITTLTANPSSLTVRTYNATLGTFDPAQAMTRNWDITETGDLEATLSFTYLAGDVAGDEADYRVWRLETDAHLQTNLCPGAPCVDTVNHVIGPVTGVTQFSRWTGAGPLAPTAAAVSVAGRVTTADGRGIRNAVLTISGNGLAQPLRTITGPFGYYNFGGLNAGETYVLTVNSKSFAFQVPSRVINLNDNVTDADFTANP